MSEYIELGTFRKLLKSRESYSKAVEVAVAIDDGLDGRKRDYDPTNSYKEVVRELLSMESEEDPDGDSSILITLEKDDLEPESVEEYVNVNLLNNEYDENLDAIDGERRLGNVGGNDHLACTGGGGLEDLGLHVRGQVGIDGGDDELPDLAAHAAGALQRVK